MDGRPPSVGAATAVRRTTSTLHHAAPLGAGTPSGTDRAAAPSSACVMQSASVSSAMAPAPLPPPPPLLLPVGAAGATRRGASSPTGTSTHRVSRQPSAATAVTSPGMMLGVAVGLGSLDTGCHCRVSLQGIKSIQGVDTQGITAVSRPTPIVVSKYRAAATVHNESMVPIHTHGYQACCRRCCRHCKLRACASPCPCRLWPLPQGVPLLQRHVTCVTSQPDYDSSCNATMQRHLGWMMCTQCRANAICSGRM